jgi:hypothetical protein
MDARPGLLGLRILRVLGRLVLIVTDEQQAVQVRVVVGQRVRAVVLALILPIVLIVFQVVPGVEAFADGR